RLERAVFGLGPVGREQAHGVADAQDQVLRVALAVGGRGAESDRDPGEAGRKAAPLTQPHRPLPLRRQEGAQAGAQRRLGKIQMLDGHPPGPLNSRLGSHRLSAGMPAISSTRVRSDTMKGSTPRTTAPMEMSGVTERITNRLTPMGGVIRPISTTTTIRMPNHTGSKPRAVMIGKKIGTV